MNKPHDHPLVAYTFVAVVSAVVVVSVWCALDMAFGAESCMTKDEARAKWKASHLYWHTDRHCWDNHSGGRDRYYVPRHEIMTPEPTPKPTHQDPPKMDEQKTVKPLIAYPDLMTGLGTENEMLKPKRMLEWPMLDEPREFIPWQERIAK